MTLNQYIITEEERKKMLRLWSVIQQHIDWQHNACHTLDLTVQDAYHLMEVVRSHPYNPQAERDKVLDEVISLINKNCFELEGKRLKITPLLLLQKIDKLHSSKQDGE